MTDLAAIWPYLLPFRAVAETEHLPSAATRLHTSASALSRSIRMLESSLGYLVFERRGRRIYLNADGHRLLEGLNAAAKTIQSHVGSDELVGGPLAISATGVVTPAFLLPALADVRSEHPELVAELHTYPTEEANARLRRGEIALAFYSDAIAASDLVIEKLHDATSSVYCSKSHPLAKKRKLTHSDLERWPFVVPFAGARGVSIDGWPVDWPRTLGMVTDSLRVRITVCRQGDLLAVIPDAVAIDESLTQLPVTLPSRQPLFAAYARPTSASQKVLAAVRARTW